MASNRPLEPSKPERIDGAELRVAYRRLLDGDLPRALLALLDYGYSRAGTHGRHVASSPERRVVADEHDGSVVDR